MAVTDLPTGLTTEATNGRPVRARPIETSGEARVPPGAYKKAMAALRRRSELQAEFGGLFAAAFNGALEPTVVGQRERLGGWRARNAERVTKK